MNQPNRYEVIISWNRLKQHISELLEAKRCLLECADGVEATRLQGDVRILKIFLNLPNTLEALDGLEGEKGAKDAG